MKSWKVKVAITHNESLYINTFHLGEMNLEEARERAQYQADIVYNNLASEFNLPTFEDCAYDMYYDLGKEDIWSLDNESLDLINQHFELLKNRYLSWALEEDK